MTLDVHVYLHNDPETPKLDQILTLLTALGAQENQLSMDLTTISAQVKATTDAENAAEVLIEGIAAQLAANKTDPVAIQALADQLKASSTKLSADIVANTPAAAVAVAP